MSVMPRPYVVIDGHRLAGQEVNNWSSIVLDDLRITQNSRSAPSEQFQLPTASVRIACTDVPEYLVRTPLSRKAEIWIEAGDDRRRVFYGVVDSCAIKPTRTATPVPGGDDYYFLVTLGLISRAAATGSVQFSTRTATGVNRPVETLASRMAWLNAVMTTRNHEAIAQAHWSMTPIFDALSGAGGFWTHRVAAKNYAGTNVVAAWFELATTAAEAGEYLPHENRLSAVGRRAVGMDPFMRLGWNPDRVGLVKNPGASGTVVDAANAPMVDMAFNDAGTVRYVQPSFTAVRPDGKGGTTEAVEKFVTSRQVSSLNLRRAEVSTLAYVDMRESSSNPNGYLAGPQATADSYADLFEDATEPYHPPLTIRWDRGWDSWGEALAWLDASSTSIGNVHVAHSVYNRLRPGRPYHRRGSLTAVYAKRTGSDERVWTTTLGLLPHKDSPAAGLQLKNVNPSATQQDPAVITYGDAPDEARLSEFAALPVEDLAAALAARTSDAFTFADFDPRLTYQDMNLATRGI